MGADEGAYGGPYWAWVSRPLGSGDAKGMVPKLILQYRWRAGLSTTARTKPKN